MHGPPPPDETEGAGKGPAGARAKRPGDSAAAVGAGAALPDGEAGDIARRIGAGDPAALEQLYGVWFERALLLARRFSGRDEAFCLDAVQDAFMRVIVSLRAAESGAALDGWMTKTVRSACIDALRREGRRLARERARRASPPDARVAAGEASLEEAIEAVWARLAELAPGDEEAIRMRFGPGLGAKASAANLGTTIDAVQGRVRRGLARLRRLLGEQHE